MPRRYPRRREVGAREEMFVPVRQLQRSVLDSSVLDNSFAFVIFSASLQL